METPALLLLWPLAGLTQRPETTPPGAALVDVYWLFPASAVPVMLMEAYSSAATLQHEAKCRVFG